MVVRPPPRHPERRVPMRSFVAIVALIGSLLSLACTPDLSEPSSPPVPPTPPTLPAQPLSLSGPVSEWTRTSVQLTSTSTGEGLSLLIDTMRVPLVRDSLRGHQLHVIIPPVRLGRHRAEVRTANDSLVAVGTVDVVPPAPAVDSTGERVLRLMTHAFDSLASLHAALGALPLPRGDSLQLARVVSAQQDASTSLAALIAGLSGSERVAVRRILAQDATDIEGAVSALVGTIREIMPQLAELQVALRAGRTLQGAALSRDFTLASATTTMSLGQCESILREIDGGVAAIANKLLAATTALASTARALSGYVHAMSVGAQLGFFTTALAVAGALATAFVTVFGIVAVTIDIITFAQAVLRPSLFVPVHGPNARLDFASARHRAGGPATDMSAWVTVGPLGLRPREIIARSLVISNALIALRLSLGQANAAAQGLLVFIPSTRSFLLNLATALVARLAQATTAIDDLLTSDSGDPPLVSVERPLRLDDGIEVAPLEGAGGSWGLAIAGSGGRFSSTPDAPQGVVDFTVTGQAAADPTDLLAAEIARVCRVQSVAPNDDGVNRLRIEPPPPHAVLETVARAYRTGEGYKILDEQRLVAAPDGPASWQLEVESPPTVDPVRHGRARNSGSKGDASVTITAEAQQTWNHPGGATWNWSGFAATLDVTVWVSGVVRPLDEVWLHYSGDATIELAPHAGGTITWSGGRRALGSQSVADSVRLQQLSTVPRDIDGRAYYPYGGIGVSIATYFAETCIIAACGRGPFVSTPRVSTRFNADVRVRAAP